LLLRVAQARAYATFSSGDWEKALLELDALRQETQKLRRGREDVEAKFLQALARKHCGLDWKAQLDEAVGLAEIFGLGRVLDDLRPLAADSDREAADGKNAAVETSPVSTGRVAPLAGHAPVVSAGGLLTAKEEEILVLLGRNLSNKQLASALCISDETVKWHIKNLFVKLKACSRRHAVDRARMLGILSDPH